MLRQSTILASINKEEEQKVKIESADWTQLNQQHTIKQEEEQQYNEAKQYFENLPNWPQSQRQRDSQVTFRLAYLILAEITKVALAGTTITFNRICDKFGIPYKTHDQIKALFGYTIDIFPFQDNYIAFMSNLTKYLQPNCYHPSYLAGGYAMKNLKRGPGKLRFDQIFHSKLQEWKQNKTTTLLDSIQLQPGLTLRKYLIADPSLTKVIIMIDEMSSYI